MLIVGLNAVVLVAALLGNDWRPGAMVALANRAFLSWVSAITAGLYLLLLGASFAVGDDASITCSVGPNCMVTMAVVRDLAAVLSLVWLAAALANVIICILSIKDETGSLMDGRSVYEWVSWTTVAVYVLILTGSYVKHAVEPHSCAQVSRSVARSWPA